jgi:hypothetical protein
MRFHSRGVAIVIGKQPLGRFASDLRRVAAVRVAHARAADRVVATRLAIRGFRLAGVPQAEERIIAMKMTHEIMLAKAPADTSSSLWSVVFR